MLWKSAELKGLRLPNAAKDSKGEIISRVGRGPAKGGMHAGEVLYYFLVD